MIYMLDTNICIDMIRKPQSRALAHIQQYRPGDIAISAITLAELEFGVQKSSDPARNTLLLIKACSVLEILPFDNDAAAAYGIVRCQLESKGTPIGPFDTLIAAHAMSQELTLVTNNMKEFNRIKDLKVENWI
ncbi:tRNA(fMet)-specific endonuclease VapC [Limihaloglobus sulfuriphilus]|uniref:Ribonuclease VapC n=1 Tax=Limihaloglobus sulfuriphilus TaxID=1851148 RepID=A0A1Q2MGE1_9BACT|nr:type II toxin-antitoxin system VapC family toxin [Limihaloglobus sulfuriphilus]AQQ71618.1 tRNA(fMet)-specific endonuclease VapC [Limihaloglobus sulfuriphilus]